MHVNALKYSDTRVFTTSTNRLPQERTGEGLRDPTGEWVPCAGGPCSSWPR